MRFATAEGVSPLMRPNATMIISTPDRRTYSDLPAYSNPFHLKELYVDEFRQLLESHFRTVRIFGQKVCHGSVMLPCTASDKAPGGNTVTYRGNFTEMIGLDRFQEAVYLIGVATDSETEPEIPVSVYEGDNAIRTNLELEHANLKQEIARRESERQQLESQRQRLESECQRLASECQQLRQSWSWRVSAPLRLAGDWAIGLTKKRNRQAFFPYWRWQSLELSPRSSLLVAVSRTVLN